MNRLRKPFKNRCFREWKNTVYITNRQFKHMERFFDYRVDAFSWNILKVEPFARTLTITQPNHQDNCILVKSYQYQSSSDSVYMVYNKRTDTFIVLRAENEDYGYVLFAFEFEDEKMARNCYHYACENVHNTYTNSNLKLMKR